MYSKRATQVFGRHAVDAEIIEKVDKTRRFEARPNNMDRRQLVWRPLVGIRLRRRGVRHCLVSSV
jgi:hypothetical protein